MSLVHPNVTLDGVQGQRWFRPPGDVRIEREGFKFYFSVMSMILISVGLSATGGYPVAIESSDA